MMLTEMSSNYKFERNADQVGTVSVWPEASQKRPDVGGGSIWAVIKLELLGFHCVTSTVEEFWAQYICEGMDRELRRMRRRR